MVPPPWVQPAGLPRQRRDNSAITPPKKLELVAAAISGKASSSATTWTVQAVVSAGFVIQCADYAAWSGIAKALEEDVGLAPTDLGKLIVIERIALAISYPFWGALVDSCRRYPLIAGAALTWSCLSFSLAAATTFAQFAFIRMCCGVCGGCLGPAAQALIGEHFSSEERGKAFGWVAFSYNLGALLGQTVAVRTQHLAFWGLHGWRSLFIVMGCLCAAFSATAAAAGKFEALPDSSWGSPSSRSGGFFATGMRLLRVPTVTVIVVQGVFRNAAVTSLSFVTMWIQYLGFSDSTTSMIVACQPLGVLSGCLFAGHVSDVIAQRYPERGRIIFGQAGDGLRAVAAVIAFAVAPAVQAHQGGLGQAASAMIALCATLFFLGFSQPWAYVGTVRPILAEVVNKQAVGSALALQKSIEYGGGALLAGPLIGYCTQHLGYDASHGITASGKEANTEALGRSLLYILTGCHLAMVSCFWLFYYTYPKDRTAVSLAGALGKLAKSPK